MPVIAVDVMGGDQAPECIISGINIFHERSPSCEFILYGDEKKVISFLRNHKSLGKVSTLVHCPYFVDSNMSPVQALREKKTSMRFALEAVADQKAEGAISAGNTGAYLALSKSILKPVEGIDRPAIASQFPTMRGESVMLDLGGSLSASSKNLVDFAMMGHIFAKHVLGLAKPSIGLLNVGHESSKGTDSLKEAALILRKLPLNFVGFIEGDDICKGAVDVIVTDGFSGNIALKMAEGVIRMVFSGLKKTFESSPWGKASGYLARPFLRDLRDHFDPRTYNGAIWLGLKGVAIKSHGGTDALGFAHALEMTHDMVLARMPLALESFLNDSFIEKAVAL